MGGKEVRGAGANKRWLHEKFNAKSGDRWLVSKDNSGKLVLIQEPNTSSGGTPSEVAVDVFLAHSGRGPEHDALVQELAALGPG